MFNADGLRARLAFGKKYAVKQDKAFVYNFMKTAQLLDGVYRVRFVPAHPEKCPSGWHLPAATRSRPCRGETYSCAGEGVLRPENPDGYWIGS